MGQNTACMCILKWAQGTQRAASRLCQSPRSFVGLKNERWYPENILTEIDYWWILFICCAW